MLKLDATKEAFDFLTGVRDNKHLAQIVRKLFALMASPRQPDARPLVGYDYFRTDVGEYRIIYRFDESSVYIALIGKRKDEVYERLRRKER